VKDPRNKRLLISLLSLSHGETEFSRLKLPTITGSSG
jgi:hypothetical protein